MSEQTAKRSGANGNYSM